MEVSLLLSLLIFFTLVSLFMGLFWAFAGADRGYRQRLQKRLNQLKGLEERQPSDSLLKTDAFSGFPLISAGLKKIRVIEPLKTLMIQADVSWPVGVLVLINLLSGMGGIILGFLANGVKGGLVGGVVGLVVPYRILVSKRRRRVKQFEKQLPDALDLLVRGLKAGYAFTVGLQMAANEMPDPIGIEFHKTFTEYNHGQDLNVALLNLCQRVPLPDLKFFTTAVMIQRETGGNLAEILDKNSSLIRERFKLRGQIRAQTGEGRLSGVVLVLLPPVTAIFLFFLNRPYVMVLLEHPLGRLMALTAMGLQLVGILLIRKIVNIKV
ncbi:MAG: type II secretion system F family protein [Desulfobaccales bacterium]|nr:type II secretion system F family protein [Desulfobaccales bacterium]